MAIGAGKYDSWCLLVREGTHAEATVLIVVNGANGNGFSVQAPLDIMLSLPKTLRIMADEIEQDNKNYL